jgi:hypothetical protein
MLRANRTLLNEGTYLEADISSLAMQLHVSGIRALGRLMALPKPNVFLQAFSDLNIEMHS